MKKYMILIIIGLIFLGCDNVVNDLMEDDINLLPSFKEKYLWDESRELYEQEVLYYSGCRFDYSQTKSLCISI